MDSIQVKIFSTFMDWVSGSLQFLQLKHSVRRQVSLDFLVENAERGKFFSSLKFDKTSQVGIRHQQSEYSISLCPCSSL